MGEFRWVDDPDGPMIDGNQGWYHAAGQKYKTIREAARVVGITLA